MAGKRKAEARAGGLEALERGKGRDLEVGKRGIEGRLMGWGQGVGEGWVDTQKGDGGEGRAEGGEKEGGVGGKVGLIKQSPEESPGFLRTSD